MHYLLNSEGIQHLAGALSTQPILAFDFDGTLAPIVPRPDDARAPTSVSAAMRRLCEIAPVAVITGRSIDDITGRLGFEPHYIIGNHGAEGMDEVNLPAMAAVVSQWQQQIQCSGIALPEGLSIEDKQYSLSIHYRLARDQEQAKHAVDALIAIMSPPPERIGGKCVINLMSPGSPNKYSALHQLLHRLDKKSAFFIGDDETDETVFRQAPPDWMTVRIEYGATSAARYYIGHQSEMAMLIQIMEDKWHKAMEVAHAGSHRAD